MCLALCYTNWKKLLFHGNCKDEKVECILFVPVTYFLLLVDRLKVFVYIATPPSSNAVNTAKCLFVLKYTHFGKFSKTS